MSVPLPATTEFSWSRLPVPSITGEPVVTANDEITLPTSLGDMVLSFYSYGIRIRFGGNRKIDYGLVRYVGPRNKVAIERGESTLSFSSTTHRLVISKASLAITLSAGERDIIHSATDGHFVREYRLPAFTRSDYGWYGNFDLSSDESIYGLGEKWGRLDKRGQLISSYNHDALGVNTEISYKNAPFAWSPEGWGVFVNTPALVTHGVGFSPWSQRSYGIFVEDEVLDLFLLTGSNGAELLEHYTQLTGRSPIPPDWSLGVIISKAYYKDADELLRVAKEIRHRKMPCDTITLDGRAWLDTKTRFSFEWDAKRYPDPKAVLDELKSLNFRICIWEYPLISVENPLHAELAQKGWLLTDRTTGKPFRFQWDAAPFGEVLTPLPDSGVFDFTHPDAYEWWRDQHKALFDVGVDMIKADFGEQVTDDMIAHNGEHGKQLHNVYAYLYNKCVYEAAEKFSESGPFLFSRASWTGCQRFPSQWGGDPQADWEGLAASLRGGLSWGMTGAPFYATDIGGFYGDKRDPKLYIRWLQAAVFSAHMRLHGIGDRVPWSYGPKAEAAATKALNLRYRLLPYLKSVVRQAHETGLPVQRAMALSCPDEAEAWRFEEQFFFGEKMLVAPCLRDDDEVRVYLPQGDWVQFPNGKAFKGGAIHRLTVPLDEVAVFVRSGDEIPLGPAVEYSAQNENLETIDRFWKAGRDTALT